VAYAYAAGAIHENRGGVLRSTKEHQETQPCEPSKAQAAEAASESGAKGMSDEKRQSEMPEIEELKRKAIEAAPIGTILVNRDAKVIWANAAMEFLTGYAREELIGQNPRLFKSGKQTREFYNEMWQTILSGRQWQGELINRRKDGEMFHESLTIVPLRDAEGRVSHFVGLKRDITDKRKIVEWSQRLAQAVEASSELIALGNADGTVSYANECFLQSLRCTKEQALGHHFRRFISPNNRPGLTKELEEANDRGVAWRGECLVLREDGTDMAVELSTSHFRDEHERIVGGMAILQDIGERRRAEEALRQSEELFRQVTENIEEVFYASDLEPPRVVYVSPAYEQIWGRGRTEIYERPTAWMETVHPEDRDRVVRTLQKQARTGTTDSEYRIVRPDESIRWIRNRTFPVKDGTGKVFRVVGFAEDITERKRVEAELQKTHEGLNLALDEASAQAVENQRLTELVEMIQCCDTHEQAYKIIEESLRAIFAPCGGALYRINPSRDDVKAVAAWGDGEKAEKTFQPHECWALRLGKPHVVREGGSPRRCSHAGANARGGHVCVPLAAQGETLGLLYFECTKNPYESSAVVRPDRWKQMAERASATGERLALALANLELREVLRQQSVRDPVTGLFNRRYMEETLDRDLSRAARRNDSLAVAMCDLDNFKAFNDSFGHEAGDVVLRHVADVLREQVRFGDIACRYGGEEFVLILPEVTPEVAHARSESLCEAVAALTISHRNQILAKVTASVGLAVYPRDGTTGEELLRAADRALYRAKSEGRARVVPASTLD
jgi:diguanylate cyclase (GGDEF)-like protein/PAS domain S-box-containing protein